MVDTEEAKWVIRTSDRGQFKKCREFWNFKSPLRRNLQPLAGPKPLDFGIAVHAGLQEYYDPERWFYPNRKAVEMLAIKTFWELCNEQEDKRKLTGLWDDDVAADFDERRELGKGMLEHYFSYAPEKDKDWRPVYVEVEFEVPMDVPWGETFVNLDEYPHLSHVDPVQSKGGVLYYKGYPVVYQGRLDVIMEYIPDGTYWIWDHKTAGQFREDMSHLDMDPQVGSYAWAIWRQLGLNIEGVIYNELRKGVPKPPKELKNGGFSQNKQQDTTYELYKRTLEGAGEDLLQYTEMLEHLKQKPNRFFRRTPVYRNPTELEILGNNASKEALDMLDRPRIYPNPSAFNCYDCPFKPPCLMKQEGSDPEFLLKDSGLYEEAS